LNTSDKLAVIRRFEKLFSSILSDTLDEMGYVSNVLSPGIRPIFANARVIGYARTAMTEYHENFVAYDQAEWLSVMIRMLGTAQSGDVFVVSTGEKVRAASWGELMSNAAQRRGAKGAIVDGAVRDVPRILSMKKPFPVFAEAFTPTDSKGRLKFVEYDIPIMCGGVHVEPGDFIFGDLDGVVCIPKREALRVAQQAEDRLRSEDRFRRAVRRGMPVGEAFTKYKTF
jgi:regulator of RNase E activity RraA